MYPQPLTRINTTQIEDYPATFDTRYDARYAPIGGGGGTTDGFDYDNAVPAQNGDSLRYNAATEMWGPAVQYYDLVMYKEGEPLVGETLINFRPGLALKLPANTFGSDCYSAIQAQATAVFSIRKNNVQVATITFNASDSVGVFSSQAEVDFLPSDKISVLCPSPKDVTLAGVSIRLRFVEV